MNINDPDAHQAKVNKAREELGLRYLCHPENKVKRINNYPVLLRNIYSKNDICEKNNKK